MTHKLHTGDSLEVMASMRANSIDAVITDPPYGLGLMGKNWDKGVPGVPFWAAALRIAKPGAHLMSFGGTRMFHRMACAIEDAGWQIRDCIMWIYCQGMPRTRDLGYQGAKGFEGYATRLKPAWEPIVMAMKPPDGKLHENAESHGVGGINVDGTRVPSHRATPTAAMRSKVKRVPIVKLDGRFQSMQGSERSREARPGEQLGRYPTNLIVDQAVDDDLIASGAKAHYFFVPKASEGEQQAGLEHLSRTVLVKMCSKCGGVHPDDVNEAPLCGCGPVVKRKINLGANNHPTVKPINLMRYLVRMVTMPKGSVILDPFMGSGTTGIACALEGQKFVGIDQDERYVKIARARIAHVQKSKQFSLYARDVSETKLRTRKKTTKTRTRLRLFE